MDNDDIIMKSVTFVLKEDIYFETIRVDVDKNNFSGLGPVLKLFSQNSIMGECDICVLVSSGKWCFEESPS